MRSDEKTGGKRVLKMFHSWIYFHLNTSYFSPGLAAGVSMATTGLEVHSPNKKVKKR